MAKTLKFYDNTEVVTFFRGTLIRYFEPDGDNVSYSYHSDASKSCIILGANTVSQNIIHDAIRDVSNTLWLAKPLKFDSIIECPKLDFNIMIIDYLFPLLEAIKPNMEIDSVHNYCEMLSKIVSFDRSIYDKLKEKYDTHIVYDIASVSNIFLVYLSRSLVVAITAALQENQAVVRFANYSIYETVCTNAYNEELDYLELVKVGNNDNEVLDTLTFNTKDDFVHRYVRPTWNIIKNNSEDLYFEPWSTLQHFGNLLDEYYLTTNAGSMDMDEFYFNNVFESDDVSDTKLLLTLLNAAENSNILKTFKGYLGNKLSKHLKDLMKESLGYEGLDRINVPEDPNAMPTGFKYAKAWRNAPIINIKDCIIQIVFDSHDHETTMCMIKYKVFGDDTEKTGYLTKDCKILDVHDGGINDAIEKDLLATFSHYQDARAFINSAIATSLVTPLANDLTTAICIKLRVEGFDISTLNRPDRPTNYDYIVGIVLTIWTKREGEKK